MPLAKLLSDEAVRQEAVQALQILDTPDEPIFDQMVELLRELSGGESAGIALIDRDRQWFKSISGREFKELPLSEGFAAFTAVNGGVLWVEDTRVDPRFCERKLVTSGRVVNYAGAPLVTASGAVIGALSFADPQPRAYCPALASQLQRIAGLVVSALQQRIQARATQQAIAWTMIRKAPVWLVVMDRDLRVAVVSEKAEAQSGQTEAELVGRSIFDIIPYLSSLKAELRRGLAGESLSRPQQPYRNRAGEMKVCDLEIVPWVGLSGEIEGVSLTLQDLTELARSEQRAMRSEERLTLALGVAETLVWDLDYRTRAVESVGEVPRFVDQQLFSAETDHTLLDLVHPDDRPRVEKDWLASIQKGLPFESEYRMCRAGQDAVWVASTARVFLDDQNRPKRLIGALRDITARKQKDLALERAREAAEAANRAKSEFLANMSHEIRTPLNGVLGVAGALGRTPLADDQRKMVRLIESSAETLESLLSDILDLARIESGKLELRVEPFDLSEVIGVVAALFARQAQEKGISFRLDQRVALERAYLGDALRLRQVLCNLLSNAVKFTGEGGVLFRVDDEPGADRQRQLRFQVIDTGVGFDEATSARLFRRFEQADGSITRQYGGTGLGLAISQSITEAMGGRLEACSVPGRGSAFTFTTPLQPAEAGSAGAFSQGERVGDEPASRRLRVLLAEDHPINREVVRLILQGVDPDLVTVENGAEAVEAVTSQAPFDLVLMDMQMPVMDGLTATRLIRERERAIGAPPTPIYALTANAMPEHAAVMLEAGADGHLSKPIAAATLLAVVAEVAEGAAPAPERRASA